MSFSLVVDVYMCGSVMSCVVCTGVLCTGPRSHSAVKQF